MRGESIFDLHLCHLLSSLNAGNGTLDNATGGEVDFLQQSLRVDAVLWPAEIALSLLSTAVSVVNTAVLTRRSMLCSSLNVLLVALELSNVVLSLFQLVISALKFASGQYLPSAGLVVLEAVAVVLTFSSAYFINWLTVVIGSWRFVAVTWPLKASGRLSKRHALTTIGALCLVSVVPAAFFALLNEMDSRQIPVCAPAADNTTTAVYYLLNSRPWTAENAELVDKVIVAINVVYYLLPCTSFVFITGGLIWNICQHSLRQRTLREGQRRGAYIEEGQTRTNVILMVMLSFFLASNTVPVVVRLIWLSGRSGDPNLFYFLTYVLSSYPLSLLTNSLSFFAYYYMGTKFRDTFHEIFCK